MIHELNSYTTVDIGPDNSVLIAQQGGKLNPASGEYEPIVSYITFKGEEFMAMCREIADKVPV